MASCEARRPPPQSKATSRLEIPGQAGHRLASPERSSATNATSHAAPSAADHRLLEAIFFVARMTLYYAGLSRLLRFVSVAQFGNPAFKGLMPPLILRRY